MPSAQQGRQTINAPARLVLPLALCVLPGLVFAQAEPAAPQAPAETLSGLAAWRALVGNTIAGRAGGDTFSEYFDAGGTVRYVDKNGASSGTWTVDQNRVCLEFPDDDDRSCPQFEVTGKTGSYVEEDGAATIRFDILPGNSKGL